MRYEVKVEGHIARVDQVFAIVEVDSDSEKPARIKVRDKAATGAID